MRSSTLPRRCRAAPRDRVDAERAPLAQDVAQRLLTRPAVGTDHHQIRRHAGLEAGVRQQHVEQLLLVDARGLRLEHQPHRRLAAGLVAHRVQHRQHPLLQLHLIGAQRLLAELDLRVAEVLDLLEHLLRRHAVRQLGEDQLPLAAREVLEHMARAHLDRAAPALVQVAQVGRRRDDLARRRGNPGPAGAAQQCFDLRVA